MRLSGIIIAAGVAIAVSGTAHAASDAVCKPFSDSLTTWMKEAAYYDAGAFVDRANPQAKAALLQAAVTMAQINMQQMAALNCPPPSAPLTPKRYFVEALECVTTADQAQARQRCDRARWTGDK